MIDFIYTERFIPGQIKMTGDPWMDGHEEEDWDGEEGGSGINLRGSALRTDNCSKNIIKIALLLFLCNYIQSGSHHRSTT